MRSRTFLFIYCLIILNLVSCKPSTPTDSATDSPEPETPVSTEILPTATPDVPLAAVVNGEGISQIQFESELKRYQSSQLNTGESDVTLKPEELVLDDMVNQVLLAQGASEKGYKVDDSVLQDRTNQLVEKLGGQAALDEWIQSQGYSSEEFQYALRISIASSWMRDQITSAVPATADQVHLRQILFIEQANAQSALQQVRAGADFATMAEEYDPITRGDIGWFPRGYLTQPQVEEAAFALQPGGVSEVITSEIGYHLIQVIERDEKHALSPDAFSVLQLQAVEKWLVDKKQTSQIEILIQ